MSIHRRLRTLAVIGFSAALLAGVPAVAGAAPGTTVHLEGDNEVPPRDTDATGHFTYQVKGDRFCYTLEVEDLTTGVVGAHVHSAVVGVNGPIVIHLAIDPTATDFTTSDCIDVDKDLVKAIRRDPELYYVNVHTTTWPGGEVRAHLG